MNLKHALVAMILLTASASLVRAQELGDRTEGKTYEIKGSYGTLVYEGRVERRETPTDVEYLVSQLKLRFEPKAKTNAAKEIVVKKIFVVATSRPPTGDGRHTVLYRDKRPTAIVLTEQSPNGTLDTLKFAIPKDVLNNADHVGMGLTDGDLLWPIPFADPASGTHKGGS